ncbi:hypothetical protein [Angustibacter sp. Root456]|uniref:hypothetical protein n=1 Tax=Angustibacter sp. Root456 TaxID=1736539 RepID=UPI0006F31FAB|nr:hypothetical protein [Angustibacter sp. Root456]KQX69544.1 hypothetical protein ASD06_00245 [Angustibacter sp. Root456]
MSALLRGALAGVAALAVLAAAGGCADPDLKAADAEATSALGSGCHPSPSPGARTTLPDDVAALPLLPDGAVVTGVESRSGQRTVVSAVVERPFDEVLPQLRRTYEQGGLVLDHGEVEEHDAESDFHGQGVKGRWGLRTAAGCDGATTVSVVVAPAS